MKQLCVPGRSNDAEYWPPDPKPSEPARHNTIALEGLTACG
ncbi:hypothetical protein [Spirosoma areae]